MMKTCERFISEIQRHAIVVLAILMLASGHTQADPTKPVMLFSADDAKQLRVTDSDWRVAPRLRSASSGPLIEFRAPAINATGDGPLIKTETPANLRVHFQANGSPVNMDSLEVTARKGLFSKSLTDTLKAYVRGTALEVTNVSIPTGKFLIEIAIADRAGMKTVETYRLQVGE